MRTGLGVVDATTFSAGPMTPLTAEPDNGERPPTQRRSMGGS